MHSELELVDVSIIRIHWNNKEMYFIRKYKFVKAKALQRSGMILRKTKLR